MTLPAGVAICWPWSEVGLNDIALSYSHEVSPFQVECASTVPISAIAVLWVIAAFPLAMTSASERNRPNGISRVRFGWNGEN